MSEQVLGTEPTELNGEAPKEQQVFINENEWLESQRELAELKGYKQGIETAELRLGQQHPEVQAPIVQAPPPEFTIHSEEELQPAIAEGDLAKYHKLASHNQEQLRKKDRWELKTQEIDPMRVAGSQTLSDLSGRFATQDMTHLDVSAVKKTYDERLTALKSQGQIINPETHKAVYEWAVGTNIDAVQEKLTQGFLRAAETEVNTPTGATGRTAGAGALEIPTPEQHFEPAALSVLSRKHSGLSPQEAADKEYKRHGGWEGYWKKFYGPKEEGK